MITPTPNPTPLISPAMIDQLVWQIVDHRIDSVDPTVLAAVARAARGADISPVIIDLLTDESAPTVMRERAFGRVAAAMFRAARPARQTAPHTRAA